MGEAVSLETTLQSIADDLDQIEAGFRWLKRAEQPGRYKHSRHRWTRCYWLYPRDVARIVATMETVCVLCGVTREQASSWCFEAAKRQNFEVHALPHQWLRGKATSA